MKVDGVNGGAYWTEAVISLLRETGKRPFLDFPGLFAYNIIDLIWKSMLCLGR